MMPALDRILFYKRSLYREIWNKTQFYRMSTVSRWQRLIFIGFLEEQKKRNCHKKKNVKNFPISQIKSPNKENNVSHFFWFTSSKHVKKYLKKPGKYVIFLSNIILVDSALFFIKNHYRKHFLQLIHFVL